MPLQKMERGVVIQQPNVLERSSRIRRSISHQLSSDFRPMRPKSPYRLRHLLCLDRGNDVKAAKDDSLGLNIHELMHVLYDIDKIVWRRVITSYSSNKYRHRHQAFIVLALNHSCFALSIMNDQKLIHPFDLFATTTGNKLEGDWGEIVALGAEISP